MLKLEVKGCKETVQDTTRYNNAFTWGCKSLFAANNQEPVLSDGCDAEIPFNIPYLGEFLGGPSALVEISMCAPQILTL